MLHLILKIKTIFIYVKIFLSFAYKDKLLTKCLCSCLISVFMSRVVIEIKYFHTRLSHDSKYYFSTTMSEIQYDDSLNRPIFFSFHAFFVFKLHLFSCFATHTLNTSFGAHSENNDITISLWVKVKGKGFLSLLFLSPFSQKHEIKR